MEHSGDHHQYERSERLSLHDLRHARDRELHHERPRRAAAHASAMPAARAQPAPHALARAVGVAGRPVAYGLDPRVGQDGLEPLGAPQAALLSVGAPVLNPPRGVGSWAPHAQRELWEHKN